MGTYFQKQAAADRLHKLAACARIERRRRLVKQSGIIEAAPLVTGPLGVIIGSQIGLRRALKKKKRHIRDILLDPLLGGLAGGAIGIGIPLAVRPLTNWAEYRQVPVYGRRITLQSPISDAE